jgi:hypothetical protein
MTKLKDRPYSRTDAGQARLTPPSHPQLPPVHQTDHVRHFSAVNAMNGDSVVLQGYALMSTESDNGHRIDQVVRIEEILAPLQLGNHPPVAILLLRPCECDPGRIVKPYGMPALKPRSSRIVAVSTVRLSYLVLERA